MSKEVGLVKRGVGRPSKAQPFRPFVVDLLLKQPNLRSLDIVGRARETGYDGGKSALYSLIASVRPRRNRPLADHDKVPGQTSRHGFGHVDARFVDGSERPVTFFVSRLEYSRWAVVSLVPDQGIESCLRALVEHYEVMGGTPLLAVFDRSRPIGVKTDHGGKVTEWDPAFAYAAAQIGVGVEVRARRGADRGPGTNLGNWLKTTFFGRGQLFRDMADVERQLTDWVRDLNARPQAEVEDKTPAILLAEERQRLRPSRVAPRELAVRFPVLVGPRGVVVHEDQSYQMPADAIGLLGTLSLYLDRVSIVAGRYETSYPRRQPTAIAPAPTPTATVSWTAPARVPLAARGLGG